MLFLSRKPGDSIVINDKITITIAEIKGKTVKLGFNAPDGTRILRQELYDKIHQENRTAAQTVDLINKVIK